MNYLWKITLHEDHGSGTKVTTFNLVAKNAAEAATKATIYKNSHDNAKFFNYSVTAIARGESVEVV